MLTSALVKTPEERGPIGNWAREQRLSRDWTPEELVERLARVGPRLKASSYRGIESGARRASDAVRIALERVFDSQAPKERPADLTTLVEALAAQTASITALVEELRLDREARKGIEQGAERAVARLAALQPPEESPAPSPPRPPRGTRHGSPVGSRGR